MPTIEDQMTTTESPAVQKLHLSIMRSITLFVFALFGMLVAAIGAGFSWQLGALTGIAIGSFVQALRYANKINLLKKNKS